MKPDTYGASAEPTGLSSQATEPASRLGSDELQSLARRCEEATGPDRELDALVDVMLRRWPEGWAPDSFTVEAEFRVVDDRGRVGVRPRIVGGTDKVRWDAPFYTASLDAAMTLVPEGSTWGVFDDGTAWVWPDERRDLLAGVQAKGVTAALGLCAAALKARANSPDGSA